jgi:o-succinylbenzoate---CoA ligase
VPTLVAIDLELSPRLFEVISDCVETRQAFCVLDQRVSAALKREQINQLGATHHLSEDGLIALEKGTGVDDEIGLVMLTSGSSGQPKAAEISWTSLEASARLTSTRLNSNPLATWVPVLPANHIGGLAVLLRSAFGYANLCWAEDIERGPDLGATHISVVQAQLMRQDLSRYKYVLLGGAKPLSALSPNVIPTWGMTETGSGIVYGGLPLDEVSVASSNNELIVKSPTLFTRYRGQARPSVIGPDGFSDWFPTGDGGEVTDGVVRVFGRIGSVITTGGEKVWPEQLETVLGQQISVKEIAVTSIPDSVWGEAIVAVVVSDGEVTLDVLSELAESQIGPWAKPKYLLKVSKLPRTPNGKLQRHTLTAMAKEHIKSN